MATDPFDFELLRRQTPTYLGLGVLKDALPMPEEPSRAGNVPTAMADVSMEDQVIPDTDDSQSEAAPEMDIQFHASFGNPARSMDGEAVEGYTPTSPPPEPDQPLHTLESTRSEPVHKVLSPTQFGTHWAVGRPDGGTSDRYGYEVRMPIPAPWHENLPYTLSTYLQLLFNLGVGVLCAWFVLLAKRDVSAIIRERSDEIALKAAWCHQEYVHNRCSPDLIVPYLFETCQELERCMDRDPANLRWLSIHASLVSEILNALIEPLTIRTMVSLGLLAASIGLAVFMINYLFGFLRARTYSPEKANANEKQLHISATPHYAQSGDKLMT